MTLLACVLVVLVLFSATVIYAVYSRCELKAGLKIPFAALFFEVKNDKRVNRANR